MCADGNTRAALPRFFLRVGITGHECGCSRSGGRIHAAPLARGQQVRFAQRAAQRAAQRFAQRFAHDFRNV